MGEMQIRTVLGLIWDHRQHLGYRVVYALLATIVHRIVNSRPQLPYPHHVINSVRKFVTELGLAIRRQPRRTTPFRDNVVDARQCWRHPGPKSRKQTRGMPRCGD